MIQYTEYENREKWLAGRQKTLGASEVAAAIGASSLRTPTHLWELKVNGVEDGQKEDNRQIRYGTLAEEHLRALYALKHESEYKVEYHGFRVYRNDKYPHLSCTLDGELFGMNGEHGIWECTTAEIHSKRADDQWAGNRIPQTYYLQILAQLLVTEFDFAVLNAELRFSDGSASIREYRIDRAEVLDDMQYIAEQTALFWKSVVEKKRPKPIITL